jgi:hypothetical protein
MCKSEQTHDALPDDHGSLRKHMATRQVLWLTLGILGVLGLVGWAGLGPRWLSGQTFGWLSALGIVLVGIVLLTIRAGQPTRTVAHVLYDAEHPDNPNR